MSQNRQEEMPKLILNQNKQILQVSVNYDVHTTYEIGSVSEGTLRVSITNNTHLPSKSLGIDRLVLESPQIQYDFISFNQDNKRHLTTRWYFFAHGKTYQKLYNGRDLLFLQTTLFGLQRAMQWEEYMEHYELAQLDIFDIHKQTGFKDDNNTLLRKWERAMEYVENYENQNYQKVDL